MIERRKHPRFKILGNLSVTIGEKIISSVAYDISKGGIGFVTPENTSIGSTATIYCPKINFKREGKIVSIGHTEKYPNILKYGVLFNDPLSDDELQRCVDLLKVQ